MNKVKIIIVVAAMLIAGALYACSQDDESDIIRAGEGGNAEAVSGVSLNSSEASVVNAGDSSEDAIIPDSDAADDVASVPETEKGIIIVHVCGAVIKPDVYELDEGSRVFDAISAAGGYAEGADEDYLNLAEVIEDATRIYVPTEEETASGETIEAITFGVGTGKSAIAGTGKSGIAGLGKTAASPQGDISGKVNINTAGIEELKTLSGIGDKRAADIINYRETHGRFESIEDIKKVPGIKEGAFSKISDYITV